MPEKTPRPFTFDPQQIDQMLTWARARILDGPDPKHGAPTFEVLEPVLGGSITEDGIGAVFEHIPQCVHDGNLPMTVLFLVSSPLTV